MKAAFIQSFGGPEVIQWGNLPDPKINSSDEALVRVRYTTLNHLDLWVRKGLPGLKVIFPHVLGADASGILEESGEEVIVHPGIACMKCNHCLMGTESLCSHYKILGEQIGGTNSELIKVPTSNIFTKPKNLTLAEASSLALVFTTAWEMLVNKAKIKKDDWVLIHGAGSGVSSAAIQIARIFGATIIVTTGTDEKMKKAKELGAHYTINYRDQNFVQEIKKLQKKGVDVIIDHVGEAHWSSNIRALRSGGTLVTCGATSGAKGLTDLNHLFFRQLKLLGSTMGSKRDFPKILDAFNEGKLRPVLEREFECDKLADAHRYLETGAQFGKVLVKW